MYCLHNQHDSDWCKKYTIRVMILDMTNICRVATGIKISKHNSLTFQFTDHKPIFIKHSTGKPGVRPFDGQTTTIDQQ